MRETFKINLEGDISWQLMPLGLKPPIDPIAYLSKTTKAAKQGSAAKQFLGTLMSSLSEIDDAGADAGRLLTVFRVALESVKKIEKADLVVGVDGAMVGSEEIGPLIVTKIRDPNVAYPHRQKEMVETIGTLHGRRFTTNTFQAICYKFKFKEDAKYCWKAIEGNLTKYSNDLVQRIKSLTDLEIQEAIAAYKAFTKARRK
jgi:hypothetical protein